MSSDWHQPLGPDDPMWAFRDDKTGVEVSFTFAEIMELAKLGKELLSLRSQGKTVMVVTPNAVILDAGPMESPDG